MPLTLRLGSSGALVKDLQEKLNRLPSKLPRILVDAVFGMQTKSRVVEFQNQNSLTADGVVGPLTWETLLELIAAAAGDVQNNLGRTAVLAVARAEATLGGVSAKLPGGPDPKNPKLTFRMGHEKLLKYFRLAAPKAGAINQTYYSEHNIRYLIAPLKIEPMPHWCGIFALWAIKTATVPVGTWIDGNGIGSVTGFKLITKTSAAPGDVGYIGTPFQHHFLIEQVYLKSGVKWVKTIEGNSSPSSNFSFQDRQLSTIDAVYSCFAPAKVFEAQPNDAFAY